MQFLKRLRVPHTLTLLFGMMILALIATWMVPQGSYDREVTEEGHEVVVQDTFQVTEDADALSPWELFTTIPRAFADAQDVIFFVLIIGGVLAVMRATGTIDALIGRMLEVFGKKPAALIFAVVFVFSLASGAIGTAGEYIPFVLILVALCRAMNLDAMVAVAITLCGYGIGYGAAYANPFTVVIAQEIAGLDNYSGWQVRAAIVLPFVLVAVHHIARYARRVQADPSKSLVADLDPVDTGITGDYPKLNLRHTLILFGFIATLVVAVTGVATQDWFLTELGACFLIFAIFAAVIGKLGVDQTAESFIRGATELTATAVLIGFARGIALVMEDGQILDTIVHYMAMPLSMLGPELAAVGMMIIQTILNFFIPSGSGQAFVTMPLMAPVGDLVDVSRQVAVLAYQFGDGFANIIVPTNAILMAILGTAGVPYGRWFRFFLPLFGKFMLLSAVILVLCVYFTPVLPGF